MVEEDATADDLGQVVHIESGRQNEEVRVDVGVAVRVRLDVVQGGVSEDDDGVGRFGVQ